MRWRHAKLFINEKSGEDELFNALFTPKEVAQIPARYMPCIIKKQELDGREITIRTQNILIKCPLSDVPDFDFMEFDGKEYRKTEIQDLERYTLFIVESSK